MRIRIHTRYDGTRYQGWQEQPHTDLTLQTQIEIALSEIFQEDIKVFGAGRTDSGVHAEMQVAHFDLKNETHYARVKPALNAQLPEDIVVTEAFVAPNDFHARHSATGKIYTYRIENNEVMDPLRRDFAHWVRKPLSIEKLNACTAYIVGTHDFKSFQTSGTRVPSTVRTIIEAGWAESGVNGIEFRVQGNGFLKQMVRNIVGTALELVLRERDPSEMMTILEALDRSKALTTAPARGLYMSQVFYPTQLDNQCRHL